MRHDIVFILGILILFTGMSSAAVTTTFVSPTANTSTFQNNLLVNATTNMTTIVNLTIRVYASINGTLMNTSQSATSPNFRNYSTLINGMPYLFNATADNATAHVSTETRNITIDKINPRILIYSPTSNTSLNATNSTNILINVTSSDININNMTLSVYNYYGGLIYNITNSTIITTITNNPTIEAICRGDTVPAIPTDCTAQVNVSDNVPFTMDFKNIVNASINGTWNLSNPNSYDTKAVLRWQTSDTAAIVEWFYLNGAGAWTRVGCPNNTVGANNTYQTDICNLTLITTVPYANLSNLKLQVVLYGADGPKNFLVDYFAVNVTSKNVSHYVNLTINTSGTYYFNTTAYDLAGNSNTTETRSGTVTRTPIYVNASYNSTVYDGHIWQTDAFSNISAALDAVSEGGTIYVYEGNYTERITINKSVNIRGNSSTSAYPVLNGVGSNDTIIIISGNVNISKMNITSGVNCIFIAGGSTINISNNQFGSSGTTGVNNILPFGNFAEVPQLNPIAGGTVSGTNRIYGPVVIKVSGTYYMWYGDGANTRFANSTMANFSDYTFPGQLLNSTQLNATDPAYNYKMFFVYNESGWTINGTYYPQVFLAYYTAQSSWSEHPKMAVSSDGLNWTYIGQTTGIWIGSTYRFTPVYEGNNVWKGWADMGQPTIQYYTSTNGQDWVLNTTNVLLAYINTTFLQPWWQGPTQGQITPQVIKLGSTYLMVYSGGLTGNNQGIGLAYSSNGGSFFQQASTNPVFYNTANDSAAAVSNWHNTRTTNANLLYDNGLWRMYFQGNNATNYMFGMATATPVTTTATVNWWGNDDGPYLDKTLGTLTTCPYCLNANCSQTTTNCNGVNPNAAFVSPTDPSGSLLGRSYISLNLSANDTGIGVNTSIIYLYNSTGGLVGSQSSNASSNFYNFTGLAEGAYYYNATVTDQLGNLNKTGTFNVTLDSNTPSIQFVTPTINSSVYLSSNSIWANVTATDSMFANMTLYLYNSTGNLVSYVPVLSKNYQEFAVGNYPVQNAICRKGYSIPTNPTDCTANVNTVGNSNFSMTAASTTPAYMNGTWNISTNSSISPTVSVIWQSDAQDAAMTKVEFWFYNVTSGLNQTVPGCSNSSTVTANIPIISTCNIRSAYPNASSLSDIRLEAKFYRPSGPKTIIVDYFGIDLGQGYYQDGSQDSNWKDGIWTTATTAANGQVFYINYTKPSNALRLNSTWNFKSGDGTYSNLLTSSCWNFNATQVSLKFSKDIFEDFGLYSIGLYCYNGSWSLIGNGGLTLDIYEESMNWTTGANINPITSFTSPLYYNFTGIDEGLYYINATAYDSSNNSNKTETRNMTVDTINPTIAFASPTRNTSTYTNNTWLAINVTAVEANIDNITIWLYNSTGSLINSANTTTSPNFFNFTGLADDRYSFNATILDKTGRTNKTETRNVTIDTTYPTIFFISPTPNSSAYLLSLTIAVNVTGSDTNLRNITIYLYNSTGSLINYTTTNTSPDDVTYVPNKDGIYYFNATVYDSNNNFNRTETRNVTIDTVNPTVRFVAPTINHSSYFNGSLFTNVTATDTNFRNVTTYVYNDTGSLIYSSITNYNAFAPFDDGIYYINATAFDNSTRSNSTETRRVIHDESNPHIHFVAPTTDDDDYLSSPHIVANVSNFDYALGNVTIWLYNKTNGALVDSATSIIGSNDSYFFHNFSDLYDGDYYLNASAMDIAGNRNKTETRTIHVDTINPTVRFISPATNNSAVLTQPYIISNVQATDVNLRNVTVNLYTSGGALLYSARNETNPSSGLLYNNFTAMVDGFYILNATAYDMAGHTNRTESRTIQISMGGPPVIIILNSSNTNRYYANKNYIYVNTNYSSNNTKNISIYIYNSTGNLKGFATNSSPLSYNLTGLGNDTYNVTITAFDILNRSSTSSYLVGLYDANISFYGDTPATYSSPLQIFNISVNASSNIGTYISQVIIYVTDPGGVPASIIYTNTNTSLSNWLLTTTISRPKGYDYTFWAEVYIGGSFNANATTESRLVVYPTDLIDDATWYATPQLNCIFRHIEKYNVQSMSMQHFYLLTDNCTVQLGQLGSGYTAATSSPTQVSTYANSSNKVLNISVNSSYGGASNNIYSNLSFTFIPALSNTQIRITFIGETNSTSTNLVSFNLTLFNNRTNYTIAIRNASPLIVSCTLNRTGFNCSNGVSQNITIPNGTQITMKVQHIGSNSQNISNSLAMEFPFLMMTPIGGIGTPYTYNNRTYYLYTTPSIPENISNPQPTVPLLLYFEGKRITPFLYYLAKIENDTTRGYGQVTLSASNTLIYNATAQITYGYNRSLIYVYDLNYDKWYVIPSFDMPPPNMPMVVNVITDSEPADIPVQGVQDMDFQRVCNYFNHTYYVQIKTNVIKTFQTQAYAYDHENSTTLIAVSDFYEGREYHNAIQVTNLTKSIWIYVNQNVVCKYNVNQTSILPFTLSPVGTGAEFIRWFLVVILFFMVALSVLYPGLAFFAFAFNGVFVLFDAYTMAATCITCFIFSIVVNWNGERSLKVMSMLMVVGLVMISTLYYGHQEMLQEIPGLANGSSQLNGKNSTLTEVMNLMGETQAALGNPGAGGNAIPFNNFDILTLPEFGLKVVIILLKLPILVAEILLSVGYWAHPAFGDIIWQFQPIIVLTGYAFLSFKIYEVSTNKFRAV